MEGLLYTTTMYSCVTSDVKTITANAYYTLQRTVDQTEMTE